MRDLRVGMQQLVHNCCAHVGQHRPGRLAPLVGVRQRADQVIHGPGPNVRKSARHLDRHRVQSVEQGALGPMPKLLPLGRLLDPVPVLASGLEGELDAPSVGAAGAVVCGGAAAAGAPAAGAACVKECDGIVGAVGAGGEPVVSDLR
jgi:hypothetical protein